MHLPGTLCFFVTLFSLTQIKEASASCDITSIRSPSASTLLVKWNYYQGATNYVLDVRAVNSTNTSPVSIPALSPSTVEKLVQGLQPGRIYQVTFKVFLLNIVTCISSQIAQTVPAISQIINSRAISSTSIKFEWSVAQGADKYFLMVNGTFHIETHNLTFTTLTGQVDNLRNNTPYSCYVYSSNAAGLGAKSLVRTIRTLVQPPDGVSVTGLTPSTARASWLSVPGVLLYQLSVRANNKLAVPLRNVTGTAVNISSLQPCLTYTIGIASVNMFLEPGEPANFTYTTSTIATVSSISVVYSCVTAMATVSWNAVFGAMSYRAVITDGQGRSLNCTSIGTTCQIPMLNCGERYSVWITAIANCESTSDGSYVFETAPCPPKAPYLYRECSSNVILFSWSPTNSTAYYHAQAVDSDGLVTDCITMDTSCYFTDSICGKGYTFYVKSIYSEGLDCNSGNTEGMMIKTAPCLPQNVYTTANCNGISSVVTSWDMAEGAQTYTVEARGNRKDFYNCTSPNTSCTLTGLECGESLSVWIIATDGNCTTDPVMGEVAETVPCSPQNVSAVGNCSSDSASLSWLTSNGAILYFGMATGADGIVHTCTAMATECTFQNLTCGMTYDAFVIATNMQCNSSGSQHVSLQTAPCIPTQVTAALNCSSNIASITWYSALGATWYLVKVEGSQGYKTSCNNTVTRCDIPNLQCGQKYSITVMGMNGGCMGPVSQSITLVSAPCPNTGIQARLDCRTNSALVSWTPGNGALNFNATLQSLQDAQKRSCFTNGSSCNISSLQCGTRYNVSVTGYGQNCSNSSKPLVTLDTAPCVPTQVNVSLFCGTDTASVSWAASSGLVSNYIVTAEGDNGITLTCNSSSTSCNISSLACGQAYNVSVTAMSVDCTGQRSEVRRVNTAPCVPQNVSANVNCSSNIATVTWGSSQGAELYSVTASSVNGLSANCTSASTSCDLSTLTCGESYTITVKAKGSNCSSGNSAPVQVQTAPCPPLNIQSRMNCGNNTASVSWSRGNGALSFLTTLECSNGQTYMCRTNETGCDITNITCGQTCLVKVLAEGRSCNSSVGTGSPIITAPCPNTGIQARLDCRTNSALVSWTPGNGALNFNATLQSLQDAQKRSCFTNGSSCNISSLQCGTRYNVSVTGYGQNCSTFSKPLVTLDTAPCVPTQVNVSLFCGTDTASVSWAASSGLVSNYIVTAEGDNGITLTCNSSSTSCNISSLACGQAYNVSVTTMSVDCTGQRSEVRRVNTAPCVPQNVLTNVSCSSNIATVTWGSSQGAELYSVTASSVNGLSANCTSASTSCDLSTLTCGESYTITVKAKGSNCSSGNSAPVQVQTAPCPPLNIQSRMNCGNNTASVSWSRGNGALSFLTTLECSNGQTYMCRTNETGCDITNITCGQTCLVKVLAEGRSCNSSVGTGSPIITAPCPNTGIQARLDCRTNSALVSWTPGNGALNFNATLQSLQDAQKRSCFTNGSSCNISSLQCGTRYNVSVTGYGQNCSTFSKPLVTLDTAPCVPTQVNVSLFCGTDTASVSWVASSGLVSNYIVTAEGDNGITRTCNSSSTSCNISSLACGQAYNVSVTTMSVDCTGQRSEVRRVNTAPCVPQNVSANVSCSSNIATVTWGSSQGAELYSVTASSVNGLLVNCTSASTSCDLSTLTCGESYTITVKAKGSNCSSGNSAPVQVQTAPCPPLNIQSRINCGNNTASVSWSRGNGALSFLTTLECSNGQTYMCRTNETGCDITNMTCGQTCLVKVLAEGRSCNSSVGTGSPIITAPCPNTGIQARLDCRTNSALVSWTPGNGALNFNATLQSLQDAQKRSCFTNGSSCNISSLQCGTRYNVSVTGYGQNCSTFSKPLVTLDTAPCVPTQVNVSLFCGTDTASVSWAASSGLVSNYIVTAEGDNGITRTCNSSSTSCNISSLACGQAYNVSVTTMSVDCTGQRSEVRRVNTAPCVPQNVSANVNCSSNIATVTWGSSQGAELYSVTASNVNGLSANCTSASTSCDLSTLTCGESYTITVKAKGSNCSSGNSAPVQVQTAPCPNTGIQARLDCRTNSALVSWTPGNGALNFNATLQSLQDAQKRSCFTNGSSCNISSLQCGTRYNVSVTGYGQNCSTFSKPLVTLDTAPCVPTQVNVSLFCGTDTASVSWAASSGLVSNYIVTAEGDNGITRTCNSSSTSCNISSLACGQAYNVSVTTMSVDCTGQRSEMRRVNTAPCVPQNVSANVNCSSNIATVTWGSSQGAELYSVTASNVNGLSANCTSASTSCDLSTLTCGESYTITVKAKGSNCSSGNSAPVQVQTAPCPNNGIQARLDCRTNSALVSWTPGNGALNFNATLQSLQDAQKRSCFTNGSSCNISSLQCGTRYNVSVTGYGQNCSTFSKPLVTLDTAPCVPTQVNVSLFCGTDTASVSWAASSGLVSNYIVTAEGDNGITRTCNSSSTSCNISSLACGQAYNVSVTTMSVDCTGQRSEMRRVNTAPCVPQNVSANVNCSSNIATVTWGSSQGAELYSVTASNVNGLSANCTSASTSCDLSTLTCGESYTITVKAKGSNCSSGNSAPVQVQTAPCPNNGIQARLDCRTNSALVSWTPGNGALNFNATLQSLQDAQKRSCFTNGSSCNISSLQCGTRYNVSVTGYGQNCSTFSKPLVTLDTAPCVPTQVNVSLFCGTDTASVSWAASSGLVSNYIVTAEGDNGITRTCNSSSTSCNISSLACGQAYNVSVTTMSVDCTGQRSEMRRVNTAPCVPQNVSANVNCSSNIATVTWGSSQGAELYSVTASNVNGLSANCTSASTSCDLSTLTCGESYTITVKAKGSNCSSGNSAPVQVQTAPCPNNGIQARLDCRTNSALVSWTPGNGALNFNATLQSLQDAQKRSCFTNGSSCNISSLQCGTRYNVSVTGYGQNCSTFSKPLVTLDTAPCVPTQVNVSLFCGTDTASVSWAASSGLVSNYIVTAEGDNGITRTCNSSSTSCNISSLACGQAYNVSVTTMSVDCTGQRSEMRRVNTAPCVPQNVSANVNCSSNIATVTWGSSQGAELYSVTASNVNGLSANCTSASTSCDLSTLTCGESYTITVKAKGSNCSSGNSAPVQVQTAPCPNNGIQARLDCRTNSALVSWTPGNGALNFNATLQSLQDAQKRSCFTNGSSCNISSLQCGTRYNVSVTGYGQNCSTCSKPLVTLDTAPCVPTQVNVSLFCGTDTASVSWAASSGLVSNYIVTAEGDNGITRTCNSSSTSCNISSLACGQAYNVSVTTMSVDCTGQRSEMRRVNTAPCVPQNVSANVNCSSNIATVTWGSSQGAELYSVTASNVNGLSANCTSASTSCDLSTLTCGESYTITVKAKGSNCSSGNSAPVQVQTAPCPNTGIQARLDCRTNSALVSWTPGNGALNFNATLQSLQDAQKRSCFTNSSSCNISSLQCGTRYNVSVTGYGQKCSTCSKPLVTLDTAPCAPSQVNVSLSCGTFTASVSWAASSGLVSNYIVTAEGDNGITLTCNSSSTSCNISSLACGQAYNVSVTAMSVDCTGQRSEVRRVNTALHSPQGVNGTVDCVTNSAWVSWDVVKGADSYTVLAVGDDGHNTTCSSPNNTCNVPDLGCGKSYTFQVTASNAACLSPPSNSFQLETAPCALSSIVVVAECQSSVIQVEWQRPRRGNSLYSVTAEDQDRVRISCNSSASSCNLTSVQCGKEYTIIVAASADQCSSLRSPPYKIRTAPCQPSQVQAITDCQSRAAFVSWEPSYVAQSYLLTAVSRDGDLKTCNTSYNNCTLTDLRCSNSYNLSVLASNENCTSLPSTNVTFKTVPCEPVNVTVNVQCNSTAFLSWVRSTGAVAYVGMAQSKNATTVYCRNTEASCTLVGLVCGTVYNFTVQATDGICNSSMSSPQIGGAAPCPPAGLRVVPLSRTVANETQILRASWSTVSCPNSEYLFGLKGSIQGNSQALFDLASYWTSRTFFEMPLPCGSSYSATIRARNSAASSAESAAVNGTTVPCAPKNVTFSASSAVVAWNESIFATNYTAYGVNSSGRTRLCMTSQFQCSIANFSSGRIVVTASNAAGESEDSVPILVLARRRR